MKQKHLYSYTNEPTTDLPMCSQEDVKTCRRIKVNFDVLWSKSPVVSLPNGIEMKFAQKKNVGSVLETTKFQCNNSGVWAFLTYTTEAGNKDNVDLHLTGVVHIPGKKNIAFHDCGFNCHLEVVVMPVDPSKFKNDMPEQKPDESDRQLGFVIVLD